MSTVADHNRKVMIYSVHSSGISGRFYVGRVARCSCWTPVYLSLEVHWSEVVPYLVIVWNPFSTTCFTVLIVPNYAGTWDASIPAILYIYFKIIRPIVLSLDFYRNGFGYRKVKTRSCLCAAWSYEILLFPKVFQRYKEISLVEFSHAGLTRLIRVLFCLYNTRIRPSIFRLGDGPLGAFRRRAGCCQGVFT